jgi:nicotinamidase-related amidase
VRDKGVRIVIEGTPGAALLPELICTPADYRVVKKRYSPFFGTGLDELLKTIGAKRLIIAGVNSHACIRAAVTDAYQRDLEVLLASDCVDSYDSEHHDVTMRYLDGRLARAVTNDNLQAEISSLVR